MELVLVALAVFALMFGTIIAASFFARARGRKEAALFQRYVAQQFPELPVPAELLVAARQSRQRGKPDIALFVARDRREVVVLFDRGAEGVTHLAYPFEALRRVDSTNQMISRGVAPSRVFSYEQTMTVSFADGSAYSFVLELPSNKRGTDKAPGLVAALFAPWEERLQAILQEHPTSSTAPPPGPPAMPAAPAAPAIAAPPTATAPAPPAPPAPPSPPRQPATPSEAAAWRADPYRRFDWRYFDGRQWTDQVSTAGQVRSDPPVPAAPPQPAHH